jgi:histidyl-tRNA synthetase
MRKHVERLRGMHDLLPAHYHHHHRISEHLHHFFAQAGYAPVDVPVLERSDLFLASFRQELWQNLYTFRLHNRDHCLRPEYTASICRLYLDQYQKQPLPLRLQYAGPVFRYETPGRGRYRQHTQLGIELFGGQPVFADAEIVQLACDTLNELGINAYRLELGHIGVASSFIQRLQLDDQAAHLLLGLMEQVSRSEEGEQRAKARLEMLYPETSEEQVLGELPAGEMRYVSSILSGLSSAFADDGKRQEIIERFTWKMGRSEQRRQILHALDFLRELHAVAGEPPEVFAALRDLLARYELNAQPLHELEQLVGIIEQSGVPREQIRLNLALGRGVSYYTGLVFEIHAQEPDGFNAQICGGGRYDQLVRAIGGSQDVRACGFSFGLERLSAILAPEAEPSSAEVLVIPVNQQNLPYALRITRALRACGQAVELDVSGHGVSAGLKLAARKQMRRAAIVGDDEERAGKITWRDLPGGAEVSITPAALAELLQKEQ